MEHNSLHGKVIAVTGGASGIGLGIVKKLVSLKAKVAVADVSAAPEELPSTAEHDNIMFTKVNVTCRQQVHDWIQEIVQRFGRLDGMCSNAGICPIEVDVASDSVYRSIMDVCVTGVWHCGTEAYWQFQRQGDEGNKGVIVNTASAAGLRGVRNMAAYCTAKHAVVGMTRSWALDWAKVGVRVNALAPGLTESAITRDLLDHHGDVAKTMMDTVPLGRMGKPNEMADSVVFLLGDTASNITGSILVCDGGMMC
ncbi:uncharacterized protein PV06_05225 [Exophiala oligosperma]|uniref:Uncharacterized protein n=1 Tax=Exophiala oligosperma TaxID=215243 RepID=A0A0D2C336_9EURO|nr:uncharacterized protein PV06_05225 [Exophiala oligosperma]KIW44197.1 hypothetical protein PV06_05225 [Exophiala oligosperma]